MITPGPAFVKVGQILSFRSDLVPPDVDAALKDRQSKVQAVDVFSTSSAWNGFRVQYPVSESGLPHPLSWAHRRTSADIWEW